jgi:hypothetical protein
VVAPADDNGQMNACGDNTYCCAGEEQQGSCNCTSKKNLVSIQPGVVQTVIGLSDPVSTQTPAFSTVTSTPTPASKPGNNSTSTPTVAPQKKKPVTSTLAFKAGLGGGLGGLVLLAIIGVAVFFWRRRDSEPVSPAGGSQGEYSGTAYLTPAEQPYMNAPTQPLRSNVNGNRSTSDPPMSTTNPFETSRSSTPANRLSVRNGADNPYD